jgi:DNA-binding transcriptional MerR regulator
MSNDNVHSLPRIGIGEAMGLYGMTARAIRFYEEKGLLTVWRDRLNRRYYDQEARQRLAWISALRGVGASLDDTREVLAAPETQRAQHALSLIRRRRRLLQIELVHLDAVAANAEALMTPAAGMLLDAKRPSLVTGDA